MSDSVAGQDPAYAKWGMSLLPALMVRWERIHGDKDLLVQLADDLATYGRYITARKFAQEAVETNYPELIENLAEIEHQRWSDWQAYFFSKCEKDDNGDLIVPAGYVAALQKLIDTPYGELSDEMKDADRREVRRYLHLVALQENGNG